MYCTSCGAKIADDSKFCPYCGKKLVALEEQLKTVSNKRPDYSKNPYEEALKQDIKPEPEEFKEPEVIEPEYIFEDQKPQEPLVDETSKCDRFAKLGHLFGLLGLLVGSIPLCIASLIMSSKGVKSNKYRYKAVSGRVLAIIGLVLWTLFLIYYIYALYDGLFIDY